MVKSAPKCTPETVNVPYNGKAAYAVPAMVTSPVSLLNCTKVLPFAKLLATKDGEGLVTNKLFTDVSVPGFGLAKDI